ASLLPYEPQPSEPPLAAQPISSHRCAHLCAPRRSYPARRDLSRSCCRRRSPCSPSPTRAALLISLFDVTGLSLLLVRVLRLVAAWHGNSPRLGWNYFND